MPAMLGGDAVRLEGARDLARIIYHGSVDFGLRTCADNYGGDPKKHTSIGMMIKQQVVYCVKPRVINVQNMWWQVYLEKALGHGHLSECVDVGVGTRVW